jgi:hypothetical protein
LFAFLTCTEFTLSTLAFNSCGFQTAPLPYFLAD